VVKHNVRPPRIEYASTILLRQLTKGLYSQGSRRIVTHYVINIYHNRLALRYSAAQLVAKDFFG
jgi:hypothetical protein